MLVGVRERESDSVHDLRGTARRERSTLEDQLEALSLDELEDNERPPLVLAGLEDLHDPRVAESSDERCLTAEALERHRAQRLLAEEHLDRDRPTQRRVERAVDDAHTAAAELARDLVLSHARRRGDRVGGGGSPRWARG